MLSGREDWELKDEAGRIVFKRMQEWIGMFTMLD